MATQIEPTFTVDKAGLAKLLARKGKEFAVTELVQSAWDENTKRVDVFLEPLEGGKARLTVEDDNPEGFADLTHAYTLFAESAKKGDAAKRGRFNLGEKLVIAICEEAMIQTTKGSIFFNDKGRVHSPKKRKAGSKFSGILHLTPDEIAQVEKVVHTLIPPPGITTTFNLTEVAPRTPLLEYEASLRTEIGDDEGRLKPTVRKTKVEVFEPLDGETAMIYEMGIPVVETGDRWHINVMQKVPLSTDRDNVPPAYLRDVRAVTLNAMYEHVDPATAKQSWTTDAISDEQATIDAINAVVIGRFGNKAVIKDPTDPESNKIAVEQGYTVIPGGALPKGAWANIKTHGVVLPAGQVTPSPDPYEDGDNLKLMEPDHYPADVANVVEFSKLFAEALMDADIEVRVVNDSQWGFLATYGPRKSGTSGQLTLNFGRLGFKWFDATRNDGAQAQTIIDLLIHEFGHHYCSDHLDRDYLNALTRLGGKAVVLGVKTPGLYERMVPLAVAS